MERGGLAPDKKGAQKRGATIVFVDESGFSERPPVRRTWAPVGKTPIIRHHFNWKKLTAIGVIACKAEGSDLRLLLDLRPGSVDRFVAADFLVKLHEEIAGPVVIVWDGLPAHRSLVVKDQVSKFDGWQIESFPGYAPELNPVEYLWSALKGKDLANFCSNTLAEVEHKIEQASCRISNEPDIIRGFLKASSLYDARTLATSKEKSL